MGIHWKYQNPKALAVDIIAPGTSGKSMTISSAIKKFVDEYKGPSPQIRNGLLSVKKITYAFSGDRKIDSITALEMHDCVQVLKKRGTGTKNPVSIRSAFVSLIRWIRTGEALDPKASRSVRVVTTNPSEEFEFRPQTLTLETITLLKNIRGLGRFAKPKLQLLQLIKTANGTPGFSLPPVGPLKEDEKERKAFIHSVSKLFKDRSIPWHLEWTPVENIFLLEKIAPASAPVEARPIVITNVGTKKIKGSKK